MRPRHSARRAALLLAGLAAGSVVVAAAAEHLAWPVAPAFPWAHSGSYSYVAGRRGEAVAHVAQVVAWGSSALAVVLSLAAVVAGAVASIARRTDGAARS
ncbi:hypothetical protein LQK89_13635 [Curtobacterium sp. C1]|uniref:hypothetical protein n=1 Tax=Curtobacterium TaxID=2034 RepID=UPI001E549AD1|nr:MULTISPECIES: hypothetical protein [Curtobacterium]UFU13543.1 hypothetical protein LQK89_13635 [Curtobacterium sp. C1]WIJ44767.1 hypothetical protein QPK07_13695 [Curtobacterium citreum]